MKPTAEEISRNKAARGETEAAPAAPGEAPVISEAPIDFSQVEIEPLFADIVEFETF